MKTFKIRHPPSNVFLSWRRIRVHVRSSPKWLKIYDINKNTKRTTLTRKTRAAAAAVEQREEIPQQEMFSGPVRFRLDGCAKPQGTHPLPAHQHPATRPFLSPWSITCQCARNENTNKLIFGLVKFNFFTSIQCPQKRPKDSGETSKSNSTTGNCGVKNRGIANGTCDCCDCWLTIKRFRFQVIACKWHKHKTKSEYLWHWIGLALMANSNSKFRSWTFPVCKY